MFRLAVIGDFQVGKSTFINALMGRRVAAMGDGLPTTKGVKNGYIVPGADICLIDSPGFNACQRDTSDAITLIRIADACLFMFRDKAVVDMEAIRKVLKTNDGTQKLILAVYNTRTPNAQSSIEVQCESLAVMKDCGVYPLLMAQDRIPIVNAKSWFERGGEPISKDERWLRWLLGLESRRIGAPLVHICQAHKEVQSFGADTQCWVVPKS